MFIIAQAGARGLLLAQASFYWDDVGLAARAADPWFRLETWFSDYDGHLMPAALALSTAVARLAPLNWYVTAGTLVFFQVVVSALTLRALVVIAGRRSAVLVPFVFFLFSPLSLPSTTWWIAALNSLGLQLGMAVAVAETVRVVRGHVRSVAPAVAGYAVGLLFFEKAVVIPVVALAVVFLSRVVRHHPRPLREPLRCGRRLWIAYGLLTALWAGGYLSVRKPNDVTHSVQYTWDAVSDTVRSVVAPGVVGGPWRWWRVNPGPPVVGTSTLLIGVGGAFALIGIVVIVRRTTRGHLIASALMSYVVMSSAAVFYFRSAEGASSLLPLAARYLGDQVWVAASAGALLLVARRRPGRWRVRAVWTRAIGVVFVLSATVSTVNYANTWADNPTRDYLEALRAGAEANDGRPMLDQALNPGIVGPLLYPNNRLARVVASLARKPTFTTSVDDLIVVDPQGRFVSGRVARTQRLAADGAQCLSSRSAGAPQEFAFRSAVPYEDWVLMFEYESAAESTIDINLNRFGAQVQVPLQRGRNNVYVSLPGAGDAIRITRRDNDVGLACIMGAVIGSPVPRANTR